MLGICSCQFIPGQFAFIVQRNMSWEHYNLALIKSWVPEYNQLQTAGQSKQVLSVMRLHLGMDGSIVMGEQYLKALERGTKVSTWADLTGSLWQHLATHTHRHINTLQVIKVMEKNFYRDTWHHTKTGDASWDHYRPVLKHQPGLLPKLLLLPRCWT